MQLSPHLDDYVRGVLRDFEVAHPGWTVKWVDVPWAEMERKVLTALAAGTPPDVVNLNPQFSAKLAEFSALSDPEAHLPPEVVRRYLGAAWNANRLDGRCFALPWYLTTNLTLGHAPLLEQVGTPEMPRDHDDLLVLARELRRSGKGYAYFPALDGSAPLENLVAMGAALFDPRCGPGFSNARGEHVFEFYQSLYREGLTPRNVVTEGHRKAVELFAAGQVAVIATGMQFLAAIRNANPRLYKEIRLAPQLNAPGVAPNIAAMNLAVTAASKQRDAAFALASFVTNPENQLAFARRVPILPSTRASYDDAFFQSAAQSAASPSGENTAELIAQARALSVQQVLKGEVAVPPVRHYNKLRNSYARHLQATMLGRLSPAQGVQATAREWSSLLRCA